MDITQFLLETRVNTANKAIELCEINRRTWQRWVANENIPKQYRKILELAGTTEMLWKDYTIKDNFLWLPNGEKIPKTQLDGWWIIKQKLARIEEMERAPVQYLLFK